MSRRKKVYGKCHICGTEGKLTFEHIPPRSAFNDHPAVLYRVFNLLNVGPDDEINAKGQLMQGGIGSYSARGAITTRGAGTEKPLPIGAIKAFSCSAKQEESLRHIIVF